MLPLPMASEILVTCRNTGCTPSFSSAAASPGLLTRILLPFKSFSDAAKCNLNNKAEGTNEHHKIESIFKAFAKAIKMAVKKDINSKYLKLIKRIDKKKY